ncbi:MAG: preprotein translocase subunit SecA [Erysipelotrichaceae bacterium]|nr:preprotein translocase subunit SecA [Erysipelotrichaceae bacterium]
MGFLDKLFNTDKKILDGIEKAAKPILDLAQTMQNLSDEELKHKTVEFRERLANGETLDDIMVEAFAVAREAAKRVIGEYPFFCQLEGALVLHRGDIAEMKTGEGKTLTSVMAVYLNALTGKGVHVITVNEYLAQRDSEWMGQIHRFLGLTVGLNLRQLTPAQKRAAYECDITYTTNSEVGFDYLRDNMVTRVEDRVLRELNFALVDEVDSILVDESRTPLIISGGERKTANQYINADRFVKRLKKEEDYVIDVKDRNVQLTEEGVHKGERAFGVENLFDIENTSLVHYINQALKANYIMHRDIEYVVEEGEVIIVDQNTGRKMPGREYSDGLHQAIQAKENVPIKQETTTMATITYQNFFRLYNKLAGMTGTAKTEEEEFLSIYNMRVVEIPTNKPVARVDYPDLVFGTKKAKFEALLEEVKELYAKGQPVLVGTISVETSEYLSKLFKQARIRHEVLNAKNHAREADIIAKAGREGSVTIATNMAGRGTDIKLTDKSRELGGLVVLGSERHESRRIDNQLRGRSGRQGDPGYSRFYVSLQDDLMVRFGSDRVTALFDQMGDIPIENKMVSKAISSAQQRVEGINFDVRKALLDYDDVMRQQRETMYAQRNFILENEDIHTVVENMFKRVIENTVEANTINDKQTTIDYESITKRLNNMGVSSFKKEMIEGLDKQATIDKCLSSSFGAYENKIEPVKSQIQPVEKTMVLRLMDRAWQNHIDIMSKLREGIHLRSYAQNNPLQAYIEEGYELFDSMMTTISNDVVTFCNNLRVVIKEKR